MSLPIDDPLGTANDDAAGYERPVPRRLALPEKGPLDPELARPLLLREAAILRTVKDRLRRIAALLPRSEEEDEMAEDLIPHDVPTYMSATIELVIGDYVVPAAAALNQAAAANDDELRRQLAEKRTRLGEHF